MSLLYKISLLHGTELEDYDVGRAVELYELDPDTRHLRRVGHGYVEFFRWSYTGFGVSGNPVTWLSYIRFL